MIELFAFLVSVLRWLLIASSGVFLGLSVAVLVVYRIIFKAGLAQHRTKHVLGLGIFSVVYVIVTAGWTAFYLSTNATFKLFWAIFLLIGLAAGIYGLLELLQEEARILHRSEDEKKVVE